MRILCFEECDALQVRKDTPSNEVRANYYRVSRLVHPDKCAHPHAAAAAAAVNQAYDTLSNPVKKVLYDRFVARVRASMPATFIFLGIAPK